MIEQREHGGDGRSTLAPAARARSRIARRLPWILVLAALVAGLAATLLIYRHRAPDCRAAARAATDAIAVSVCEREFEGTGDPAVGVLLADAQRRLGNMNVASAIASGLLATPHRADALQILGKIAVAQARFDAASDALERARELHRAADQRAELARDDQALAGVLTKREQYAEALRILDECIGEARAGGDQGIEGYCHLSSAQVLSRIGYFDASGHEIDLAEPLSTSARDLAWLEVARGDLLQELGRSPIPTQHFERSVSAFARALGLASSAQLPRLQLTTELNLVYSLAELRRTGDAERHLDAARVLDFDGHYASQRAQLAARIAYRRGDLAVASSQNDRLFDTITDDDERLDVCVMQARIALASHDLALAETWARRGVAQAEKIRAAQTVIELRAWILSSRRDPYELLFTALARAGRFEAALAIFDQWQGRTLLDVVSRSTSTKPVELRGAAARLDRLGAWLPVASAAPLMRTDAGHTLTADLRNLDVLALVIADGDLWSVTTGGGELHMTDLGAIGALQDRLDRFQSAPTDRALADELGELLVPDTTFRATQDTLRVVLDGPLSGLPIAALRHHGRPLISVRPIVHAPRLSELTCLGASDRAHAVVLADPRGDLPEARREAEVIASLLGTTSTMGPAATTKALLAAARGDVLHVAAHADIEVDGGLLYLSDQAISALEIAARGLGPALVVLSACDSALSSDAELAGALSTAFLASGSTQVVATLRPVSDAGARELTTRFYRDGGVRDPVRVLAHIQASLSRTNNTDWPSFAVFGHDFCTTKP
jgi:tetratricopeptide (TPR) repeat protein